VWDWGSYKETVGDYLGRTSNWLCRLCSLAVVHYFALVSSAFLFSFSCTPCPHYRDGSFSYVSGGCSAE